MQYETIYTIVENQKSNYENDLLFWGKVIVCDYKSLDKNLKFNTFNGCYSYFKSNNINFRKYHIRKTVVSSGGVYNKEIYLHN